MQRSLELKVLVWLGAVLGLHLALSAVMVAGVTLSGEPARAAVRAVGATQGLSLLEPVHEDSWFPMLAAYQLKARDPAADMYSLFFSDRIKFQYPPSSILVLDLVPSFVTGYVPPSADVMITKRLEAFMTWPSRLACLLAIVCAACLVELSLTRLAPEQPVHTGLRVARVLACCALGLTFYPLQKSYELGQIQVFLNGFVALALLLSLLGRPAASGVLFSLCCMVKPQYGAVLGLALLTRQWRFAAGFGITFGIGLLLSVARFGLHDHLRYLQVLQVISRRGEIYWPNQSVNGLLHRFLGSGDPVHFTEDDFAPYRLGVYVASLASALALLGLALWPRAPRLARFADHDYHRTLALALAVAAATMGSPVAWEHHYGSFLAIFAVAVPGALCARPFGRFTAPLSALSYVLVANALLRPEWLFANRWLGLLGSHLFAGCLILFSLLFTLLGPTRRAGSRQARSRYGEALA